VRRPLLAAFLLLAAACTPGVPPDRGITPPARLLVVGSLDLSGAAASIAAADPEGLFRDLRYVVRGVDLAIVGPLTGRPPIDGTVALLADAGFDAVLIGGEPATVRPLPAAVAGLSPIAAGPGTVLPAGGLRVAVLESDAGWMGIGDWSRLARARLGADATVVLLDGPSGVAFPIGRRLARSGADVVVVLAEAGTSVEVIEADGERRSVLAGGLGPLLSADGGPTGRGGSLLEVLVDASGVAAYRLGRSTHGDLRAHFAGWELPSGDAALLDGEWWALTRAVEPAVLRVPATTTAFDHGDLIAAALGDVDGDGTGDIIASYRHPFRPSAVSEFWPAAVTVDSLGRSAHLGVFDLDWRSIWLAGRLPHPVGALAACEGAVALAYTGLDDPLVVATGAAVWDGFGLRSMPELPGPGTPGCADVDGDGRLDPVVLDRGD
jgi:hypothetical protein